MLHNISPVDGRYATQTSDLRTYFSEAALMRYRVQIEIEYFIALFETGIIPDNLYIYDAKNKKVLHPEITDEQKSGLRSIYKNFSDEDATSIKISETTINHDVKAIEYFVKDKLTTLNLSEFKEWVHFGLTSQDINNSAFPLMIRSAYREVLIPEFKSVRQSIFDFAQQTLAIPMMAYTHGQPASPTLLGKEMMVFVDRLDTQIDQMEKTELRVKFGGATGNFNAHVVAFPEMDWAKWADNFTHSYLNIERYKYTTQIEHYDQIAALCHVTMRTNTILIDFCRDVWAYISMNYISQKANPNEVGSSAMPHKVNPIDFENAEGNLGYANAIFGHLADKLPVSRLQRDLTDSTVSRNIGVPVAHTFLALQSIEKGLRKISPNESRMAADLDDNWTVLAEAIQTVLRREGVSNPYELLKDLTRGKEKLTKESLHEFIHKLSVHEGVKDELLKLTPSGYTGVSLQ